MSFRQESKEQVRRCSGGVPMLHTCSWRDQTKPSSVLANPGEEQTRGNESVKFEVYGEKALLKGAELSLCCSGCDK